MREILFRGKRKDNGEWVVGDSLVHSMYKKGDVRIGVIEGLAIYSVIPESVSEFTGLTDKNGTKIFEGDIGRYKQRDGAKINGNPMICIGEVVYNEKTASFAVDSKDEIGAKNYDYFPIKDFEIIGNMHDNPELLGGGEG